MAALMARNRDLANEGFDQKHLTDRVLPLARDDKPQLVDVLSSSPT